MSTKETDRVICFELSSHARMFNRLELAMTGEESGCLFTSELLFARGFASICGVYDQQNITVELKNVESTVMSLAELQPLPKYSPKSTLLGAVDLQIMSIATDSLDDSDMIVLRDTSSFVSEGSDIKHVFSAVKATISAFTGSVFERGDSMAKALLTIQKYYQRRPHHPDHHYVINNQFNDMEKLKLAKELFPFAVASLGWMGVTAVGHGEGLAELLSHEYDLNAALKFLNIAPLDVLRHQFAPKGLFKPSYLVFKSDKLDAIVVAMRCSIDSTDFISDMICQYTDFMGGFTHQGILKCSQWIFDETVDLLREHIDVKKIYVTGHSLGGGISVLLSIMYHNRFTPLGKTVKCVALAPPPVVTAELANQIRSYIDIYVFDEDIVPRLSYGGFVDIQTLQRYCAYLNDNNPTMEEDEMFKHLDECRKAIKERSTAVKLCHPGTVILTCVVNQKVLGIVCPNDAFNEVRLSTQMIPHHFPHWYGWSIAELVMRADNAN